MEKVEYEKHPDYRPGKDTVRYMMTMEDGTHVGSVQPAEVAEEIIHCASTVETLSEPLEGYALRAVTAYGHEYHYDLADFEEVTVSE